MENIVLKNILIPTDFSKHSEAAIHFALSLAKKFNSEIYFLNVSPPEFAFYSGMRTSVHTEVKREEERDVKKHREWLEEFVKKFNVEELRVNHLVKSGPPFLEIIIAAREINADLIVMGTHGRTGLSHVMIGSVAEKVVRKSPCPVLTVKPKALKFEMP